MMMKPHSRTADENVPVKEFALINHIINVHVCPYIVTTSTPMTSRVEDESAAHFVAEYREESTSQPRCCQSRRGPKGETTSRRWCCPPRRRSSRRRRRRSST